MVFIYTDQVGGEMGRFGRKSYWARGNGNTQREGWDWMTGNAFCFSFPRLVLSSHMCGCLHRSPIDPPTLHSTDQRLIAISRNLLGQACERGGEETLVFIIISSTILLFISKFLQSILSMRTSSLCGIFFLLCSPCAFRKPRVNKRFGKDFVPLAWDANGRVNQGMMRWAGME